MRLIACPECHAQYDVSGVLADTVACRCGETLANETLTPVDSRVERCGACGAHTDPEAATCAYCGAERTLETDLSLICPECFARNADASRFCTACGVAFRPEALCVEGAELPCPACDLLMPPSQVAGIGLNECGKCRGLWVPGGNFDALVERATENRRNAEGVAAPRVDGGNPADRAVRYRKCPECMAFMHRTNYRRSSGVVLDVCRDHGTWLDADELEEIAGFILSGGRVSATLEEEHQSTSIDAAAAAAFARARIASENRSYRNREPASITGGLLQILSDILT